MKQSVMWPLVRLNSGVHIGGACRRVGARDATARPWNTSLQDPSPPAGRLLDTLQTALAESFVLGNGATVLDVPVNIGDDELAVAAHPALEIDKMVIVADATNVRHDLLTLLSEALVLTTRRFEYLLGLLQAHDCFWGTARPVRFGLVTRGLGTGLYVFELLPGFGDGLVCRPLFRGHGPGDRFDQLVLHMEQVRLVVRLQIVL